MYNAEADYLTQGTIKRFLPNMVRVNTIAQASMNIKVVKNPNIYNVARVI